jgi:hypothetical protein
MQGIAKAGEFHSYMIEKCHKAKVHVELWITVGKESGGIVDCKIDF